MLYSFIKDIIPVSDIIIDDNSIEQVERLTLFSPTLQVTILSYGGTITSVKQLNPNTNEFDELTICYQTPNELLKYGSSFGRTVGRFANRIRLGRFQVDNIEYQIPINNGVNSLHGGLKGFGDRNWEIEGFVNENLSEVGVKLVYVANDNEEGYPGEVTTTVTYTIDSQSRLNMTFEATTTKATPVNITNHCYWNLSGNQTRNIYEQTLQLSCHAYLPVDETKIPTGELASVENTLFDFITPKRLGSVVPLVDGGGKSGIDHCFVIDNWLNNGTLYHTATLIDHEAKRQMIVETTQPSVQVYTGNFMSTEQSMFPFVQHNAICLETQHFPDSPNQSHFPNTILHPGEKYYHKAVYSFSYI